MPDVRVYKLAEQLGVDREALVALARTHGLEFVKNSMAKLTQEQAEQLTDLFDEKGIPDTSPQPAAPVIRRRQPAPQRQAPPAGAQVLATPHPYSQVFRSRLVKIVVGLVVVAFLEWLVRGETIVGIAVLLGSFMVIAMAVVRLFAVPPVFRLDGDRIFADKLLPPEGVTPDMLRGVRKTTLFGFLIGIAVVYETKEGKKRQFGMASAAYPKEDFQRFGRLFGVFEKEAPPAA